MRSGKSGRCAYGRGRHGRGHGEEEGEEGFWLPQHPKG